MTAPRTDKDIFCTTCGGFRPHREQPSPDAGPGWRCSECGGLFEDDEHGGARRAETEQAAEMRAVMDALGAQPGEDPRHAAERVRHEWTRTHKLAQQQAAELVRLTATIKALADALETARRCIVNRVTRTEDWAVIDAALQRAVRRR